jgi:23S rRNA (guanosine2251-2'-O)-methyltransferase
MTARLLYGFHAVRARLRQHPGTVEELLIDARRDDARARDMLQLAGQSGVAVRRVEARRLDDLTQGESHQGVVARVGEVVWPTHLDDVLAGLREPALLLVLDGVTDPRNLGAILRCAAAFGVHAAVAPKDRAVGITPTVAKAASGALEALPYFMVTNLARTLRDLKDQGVWLLGAEGEAETTLAQVDQRGPIAWVLGAEGEGLRRLTREHCDTLARIPMTGAVESLNVAVSAGICLYEARRQRGEAR